MSGAQGQHYHDGYIDDRPVGSDGDLLWADSDFIKNIDRVARRFVLALDPDHASAANSLTVAIHGKWGMGKSSALKILEESATRQVGPANRSNLYFCRFPAPVYENSLFDVRVTLAYRILRTLMDKNSDVSKALAEEAASFAGMENLIPAGPPTDNSGRDTFITQNLASTITSLIDLSAVIRGKLYDPRTGVNKVMVVIVDDLDRCKRGYVWNVIDAIQQFGDTPNLFFVLAVDHDRLLRDVQERFKDSSTESISSVDPDYALEKYVQIAVNVPDLETDGLSKYIRAILQGPLAGNEQAGGTPPMDNDLFVDAVANNTDFFREGLRELTPRSVKRCLNVITPDLKRRISGFTAGSRAASTNENILLALKESILQYVWPVFYRKLFVPAMVRQDVLSRAAFERFEQLSSSYFQTRDDEQLRFSLQQFSTRFGRKLDSLGIDLTPDEKFEEAKRMATYIGRLPFWTIGVDDSRRGGGGSGGSSGGGARPSDSSSSGKTSSTEIVGLPVQAKDDIGQRQPEPDALNEFLRLYVASELGYEQGQSVTSLQAAQKLYDLVTEKRDAFDKERAGQVGNVAINAERFRDYPLAVELYELALELDPEHSNNMQNYVDLILTQHLRNLYPRAQQILDRLKTGKHRDHRYERTLAMDAQLRSELGLPEDTVDPSQVEHIIAEFMANPTNVQMYIGLMNLLTQMSDYQNMRRISFQMYLHATEDYDRYVPLRAYADTLAASPSTENELQAMDIYRYILANFSGPKVDEYRSSILQNFATLLYKHDYDPEAGELWYQAYQLEPGNNSIRNAYSMYLIRANRSDVANLVIDGKPLSEIVKQPQTKRVPDRFWSGTDRWWERSGNALMPRL